MTDESWFVNARLLPLGWDNSPSAPPAISQINLLGDDPTLGLALPSWLLPSWGSLPCLSISLLVFPGISTASGDPKQHRPRHAQETAELTSETKSHQPRKRLWRFDERTYLRWVQPPGSNGMHSVTDGANGLRQAHDTIPWVASWSGSLPLQALSIPHGEVGLQQCSPPTLFINGTSE